MWCGWTNTDYNTWSATRFLDVPQELAPQARSGCDEKVRRSGSLVGGFDRREDGDPRR